MWASEAVARSGTAAGRVLPGGRASAWNGDDESLRSLFRFEPNRRLVSLRDGGTHHFQWGEPFQRRIEKDTLTLDVPRGSLPFTEPIDPSSGPRACRVYEPWTVDWFIAKLFYAFVVVPFIVWTITPLRCAAFYFLAVGVGIASARIGTGAGQTRLAPVHSQALRTAIFGFLPAIALPALAQVVFTFWWAFDHSEIVRDGPNVVSFGPFAYGVINTGSLLLGLVIAMWAARRALKPTAPPTKAWRRLQSTLLIASVLCYTYPITSAWINLIIPGPEGRYWLPF